MRKIEMSRDHDRIFIRVWSNFSKLKRPEKSHVEPIIWAFYQIYFNNLLLHLFQAAFIILEMGWKKSDNLSKNESLFRNSKLFLILFNSFSKFGEDPNRKLAPEIFRSWPRKPSLGALNSLLLGTTFSFGLTTGLR